MTYISCSVWYSNLRWDKMFLLTTLTVSMKTAKIKPSWFNTGLHVYSKPKHQKVVSIPNTEECINSEMFAFYEKDPLRSDVSECHQQRCLNFFFFSRQINRLFKCLHCAQLLFVWKERPAWELQLFWQLNCAKLFRITGRATVFRVAGLKYSAKTLINMVSFFGESKTSNCWRGEGLTIWSKSTNTPVSKEQI